MAFTFRKPVGGETTKPATKKDPMAYIFIGNDPYRTSSDRTAQDWRKLFLVLASFAQSDGKPVSNNEFGLSMVYDALEKLEEQAREELGDDFDSAVDARWTEILAKEQDKRARKAAADAANPDLEQELEESVEQATKPETKPATKPETKTKK